jgi:hypothetical protein
MAAAVEVSAPARRLHRKLAAAALLIPALYVPTLFLHFDFYDDGCLAYPAPASSFVQYLVHVWDTSVQDFQTHGPFRPVCWAHLEGAAQLFGPNAFARRVARLFWACLSTGVLLWLLQELGFPFPAVLGAATLALWNRYRNEIWLGLGLTEAFAMPYALLALVAALRASRSRRPWPWDVLGVVCLLAALGIKNTFAAVVPVAVVLRLIGGGLSLREGWRRHGRAAAALGLTLCYPVTHFILFRLNPRDLPYKVDFTWEQGPRMLRAVASAANGEFLVFGLLVPLVAGWLWRRRAGSEVQGRGLAGPFRPALWAGCLLTVLGIGIYLPINGVAGRYTMPAVWGLDILTAFLLAAVLATAGAFWKRFALAGLAVCLLTAAIGSLGREWKSWARNDALWQALEFVEQQAPPGAAVAWVGTDSDRPGPHELYFIEGRHFSWHLQGRGRHDLDIPRVETRDSSQFLMDGAAGPGPALVVAGTAPPAGNADWQVVKVFRTGYWGVRRFECFVWGRRPPQPHPLPAFPG